MSGNRVVIDTNVAIYFLLGDEKVADYFYSFSPVFSFVSELELLSGSDFTDLQTAEIQLFLSKQTILDYIPAIKSHILNIRKRKKIKLPDAIIAATAMYFDIPLVSSDKGFKGIEGLTLIYHDPTI